MNFIEDDDRSSSADSFCLVENHNKADDANGGDNHESGQLANSHQNKEKVHYHQEKLESSFKSTSKEPSVVEISKLSYNDFIIGIFTGIHDRRFYFEPLVQLDPSSIASESNELLKRNLVRFKIKMWDAAVRSKVLDRLRSLPSLKNVDIEEEDVHVMPYEEVQLVVKPDNVPKTIRLADEATSYRRLCKNLHFDFECDTPSVADALAENLKRNPELIVKKWKLALECRGLAPGTGAAGSVKIQSTNIVEERRPTWIFNVSTFSCDAVQSDDIIRESMTTSLLPSLTGRDRDTQDLKAMIITGSSKIQDLEDQIKALSNKKSATCVPVYSVKVCTNPSAFSGHSFGFSTFVMEERTDHGEFDLSSGIYTVKTAGIYQLNFYAHVEFEVGYEEHQFDLKINDETVAISCNHSDTSGYQPAVISTMLPLKAGDMAGIFSNCGKLYQDEDCITRFFGILLLDASLNE